MVLILMLGFVIIVAIYDVTGWVKAKGFFTEFTGGFKYTSNAR